MLWWNTDWIEDFLAFPFVLAISVLFIFGFCTRAFSHVVWDGLYGLDLMVRSIMKNRLLDRSSISI